MKNQVNHRSIREKGNGTLEALAVLIVLVLPLLMFTVESTGITRARAVAAQAAQEAARSFATADNTASGTARARAVVHAAVSDAAVSSAGLSGAPPADLLLRTPVPEPGSTHHRHG